MSQATTDADDGTDVETSTDVLIGQLADVRDQIEEIDQDDVSDVDDGQLVKLRNHLKELEDSVEDARSDEVDAELNTRIEPGESLFGLNRIESHRKYVDEDVGTVIMRAVSKEIDYTQFVSIDASTLADVAPDIAEIKHHEYTYLR